MSVEILIPTNLNYFSPPEDGSKPYLQFGASGNPERNWEAKPAPVKIENVRGKEDTFILDKTGFEFHKAPTSLTADDFENNEKKIKNVYYKEVVDTVKRYTGASKIVVFDHTLRSNDPTPNNDRPRRQTAGQVHVDQTPSAAAARVVRHLPASEAAHLLKKHYQIVNLWRPIRHPAYDKPLAVCDFTSINFHRDLVPTVLKYPSYSGENFSVTYNPSHRWKYLRGMTPDEIILIKCADSITDGSVSVCTPHTAFEDPTTPKDAKFRESIEVRTLVFYD